MDNLEDKAWKSLLSQRRLLKVSDDEAVEEDQQRRKSKAPYQYYVYDDGKDVAPDTPMTNIVKLLNRQRPGDDHDDDSRPESPNWTKRDETIEHHSPVFNNWRF